LLKLVERVRVWFKTFTFLSGKRHGNDVNAGSKAPFHVEPWNSSRERRYRNTKPKVPQVRDSELVCLCGTGWVEWINDSINRSEERTPLVWLTRRQCSILSSG
jgi:hypothetical protein